MSTVSPYLCPNCFAQRVDGAPGGDDPGFHGHPVKLPLGRASLSAPATVGHNLDRIPENPPLLLCRTCGYEEEAPVDPPEPAQPDRGPVGAEGADRPGAWLETPQLPETRDDAPPPPPDADTDEGSS